MRGTAIGFAIGVAIAFGAEVARAACTTDAECTAPPLVRCDAAELGGACVECLADADCRSGLLCERDRLRAGFSKCVACAEGRTSGCRREDKGAACLSSGSCGCLRDDDCGDPTTLRVCAGGECTSGCRGDGSRSCPTGQSCTARGAGTGDCVRDPAGTTVRADAGLPNPTPPPVGPGGNCSIGREMRREVDDGDFALTIVVGMAMLATARKKRARASLGLGLGLRALAAALPIVIGCSRTPTPLRPGYEGSVGLPHRGVLIGGERVAETEHLKFLRDNDRRWATPRFGKVLTRAAERVAKERPGAALVLGDLSAKGGGVLMPHLSHRSGRDADVLLYLVTLDGAVVTSPGFVHVREDGLAWDERGKRFVRFDVERQWLLLKAMLEDPDGHVQFVFASRNIRALLAEWAIARGESMEIVYRALTVMVQPNPGGEHDDHFHVRTACTDEEVVAGCEPSGPERPWLARQSAEATDPIELARALFEPIEGTVFAAPSTARSAR